MKNDRVVDVLRNEKRCVLRNIRGCGRDCSKCDLVLPDEVVLEALDTAIKIVQEAGDD